ncbi:MULTISPECIES: class I adenylate-forming enzyme family protein [unclassified Bradyrhizobium]|uniref:class I adenylate-forming enzyme family protein n=1 Tax=unclassified Bradyrhizobium TaxID=2631580 RepID=UPI0029163FFC|nr:MULTISPECIES: class I adenylate-forming enzyme family protein [unclassified Bradyrhizobium]
MCLFHHYIERSVRDCPEKIAVKIDGACATYRELDDIGNQVAGRLVDDGIRAGDRVAIYGVISIRLLGVVLGIFKAGAVLVGVHHTFGLRKLMFELRDSGACAVITDRAAELRERQLDYTIYSCKDDFSAAVPERDCSFCREVREEDISVIFYTSGSTSRPKGVAVNHKNMIAAFESVTGYLRNTSEDVVLSYSTLGSDYGFYNVMMPLMFGGTALVERALPDDPDEIIDLIDAHGVTGLQVFPPFIFHLLKASALGRRAPRSLRYISTSGQALPVKHIRRLREAWPGVQIFSNYGLTECKRVSFLPPDEIDQRPQSVGRAIPGVRTYLFAEDRSLVTEPGQVGELGVAGDLLMQKYWNMPDETSARMIEGAAGEARVFLTGDLFRVDGQGYLYYVARKDDAFARSGFKVNPREIEQLLMAHPAVSEAAVVPVADESVGHLPKALIVAEQATSITSHELVEYCTMHLDWHMVPAFVEFVPALPRTASGKTATRALS